MQEISKENEDRSGNVPKLPAFAKAILDAMDRVEYRRCTDGEDMEAVCRLRYKAFHTHGLLDPSPEQRLSDNLDKAVNCLCYGIFMDGALVSTVRLHHLTADTPYAPSMTVFADRLVPRLAHGETFIDPSRLAVDPKASQASRLLPYLTLRLSVIANTYFGTTANVAMIREEHTSFYSRVFDSVQVGDPRLYPPFTMPIFFYESNCERNMPGILRRYPFFRSTPLEREALFSRGGGASRSVRPAAREACAEVGIV